MNTGIYIYKTKVNLYRNDKIQKKKMRELSLGSPAPLYE